MSAPSISDSIHSYVRQLVKHFNPQTVLLFGSQATGTSDADSDVDLLVVMEHDKKRDVEQEIEIDRTLSRPFPLDILVRRPVEVRRRLAARDMALTTMFKTGKRLYERSPHHA